MENSRKRKTSILILLILFAGSVLLAFPEKDEFKIGHFGLNIEITPERHWLQGEAAIKIRSETQGMDSLHFYIRPSLRVYSVKDEKNPSLEFSQTTVKRIFPNSDTSLVRIKLAQELAEGEKTEVVISYAGIFHMSSAFNPEERRYNRAFSSITKEAAWLRSVQLWYPYIPEKSMSLSIRARVPSEWTVVTNGELEQIDLEKDKRVFSFQEQETSSLDIILFAAPYISKSKDINGFHITAYLFPQHQEFLEPYLEKTGEILSFYTQKFGRPKAKTFSVIEIGTGYGTGTSSPFGYAISSHLINLGFPLLPHEIAHLWWGETVADNLGKDTWLHEGLATFSDYCYLAHKAPDRSAQRRLHFALLNRAIPIGNPKTLSILEGGEKHAPEGFLVYERAASMLFTLKSILGEEVFFKALRGYLEAFRNKKADTDGFIQIFESISGRELDWFFDFYLRGKRPPLYKLSFRNFSDQVIGTLSQENVPENFRMPVTLEFITNQRSFRREVEVKGSKKKFICSLEKGEHVYRIIIDPDFEILAVREELDDRWNARSLRLEAAKKKNFKHVKPLLFALWEKHPDNVHILHEVAQFYFAQKKWEKGIEVYQKILTLDPHDFSFIALANIAGAYETMGDHKMQRLYLEKALAKGSSMYSIIRSIMDKLEKLKEKMSGDSLDDDEGHVVHLICPRGELPDFLTNFI